MVNSFDEWNPLQEIIVGSPISYDTQELELSFKLFFHDVAFANMWFPYLAWMPFGAGKRMCIGEEFAMLQGQLILAQVLQRYSLSAIPDYTPPLQMATNLRPKAGVWVNIRNRE